MIEFQAGDRVKVIGQDIVGILLRVHRYPMRLWIPDDYSEYEAPDDELVYRHDELQLLDSEGEETVSWMKCETWSLGTTATSGRTGTNGKRKRYMVRVC